MRGAPRGGPSLGLRTGTALGVLGGIAIGLCLVAPVVAEPRGAYEELIRAPLRRLLAPCLLMAEQCQARGEHEVTCRPRVERCIRDIEEQAKEQALREMEKEDPGARRTMEAIEAQSACTQGILDCIRAAPEQDRPRAFGPCVTAARTCPLGPPGSGPSNCCPRACIEAFQVLAQQGTDAQEAFARVFLRDPGCFPGVPRPPR